MSELYSYPSNDYRSYLAHHGVKGMRWGVRHDKYSKYRKNREKYVRTNKVLDAMENTQKGTPEYGNLKRKVKRAASYDRGRDLYSQGKTITDVTRGSSIRGKAYALAGVAAAVASPNANYRVRLGNYAFNIPMKAANPAIVAAGSGILEYIVGYNSRRQSRDLRAYYSGGPKIGNNRRKQ